MAQPMHIQVTGLITDRHPINESITIRKIDDGDNIIKQWYLENEDDGVVNPADIQVTGLPAVASTDTEVTIVKTNRIGEHNEQWEVQEPVAPAQEPVAPPQEPVAPAEEPVANTSNLDEVDGGRRSRRQGGSKKKKSKGGSKKKSKGWGGSKKQKKDCGGSKKQKKHKGSKKRR